MNKLEKLKAENKRLKVKSKKATTYLSSSKDGDSSFKEEVSNKGRKGRNKLDKPSYNSMSFNYNSMQTLPLTLLCPLARLPILMGQTITNGSIA
jgi:hypothetical protein